MIEFGGEEFYHSREASASFIREVTESLISCGLSPGEIDIERGRPLIMDNDTAANFLFANYLLAADFRPGRPPAIAEVGGRITDSGGGRSMETPVRHFRNAKEVLTAFREVEPEYTDVYERLVGAKASGPDEDFAGIKVEGKLDELMREIADRYGETSSIPVLTNGIWTINALQIDSGKEKNDREEAPSYHTHPGGDHWSRCAFSEMDFINCIRKTVRKSGESENYVMHVPAHALRMVNELLPGDHAAEFEEKVELMMANPDFLDRPMERDMLGVRYVWRPENGRLIISPVLAKIHYDALNGKIPEGVGMGVKGFYTTNRGVSTAFNLLRLA